MSQNLSSTAVVIGALMVKNILHVCFHDNIIWMHNSNFSKIFYGQIMYVLKF